MPRSKVALEVSKDRSKATASSSDASLLCETYTDRDYEVVLDVLYGLFSREDAVKVRVFDPFIADTQRAPLVTPRMLAERIEKLLGENTNA